MSLSGFTREDVSEGLWRNGATDGDKAASPYLVLNTHRRRYEFDVTTTSTVSPTSRVMWSDG
jgi:hypothetical protein